jgi:hypothetical protein
VAWKCEGHLSHWITPEPRALTLIRRDDSLEHATLAKGERIMAAVTATADSVPGAPILVRGRGMACGSAAERQMDAGPAWSGGGIVRSS